MVLLLMTFCAQISRSQRFLKSNVSKTVHLKDINRKPYLTHQMVPCLVTLTDLMSCGFVSISRTFRNMLKVICQLCWLNWLLCCYAEYLQVLRTYTLYSVSDILGLTNKLLKVTKSDSKSVSILTYLFLSQSYMHSPCSVWLESAAIMTQQLRLRQHSIFATCHTIYKSCMSDLQLILLLCSRNVGLEWGNAEH